ncbi:LysM peptidoglycan-binding domain-containing protein [Donghicola mangrovi]|uniref:LysM peptidoglycan-binding domain-containing protein n=1 Tax=Donghicola mangrovi TaxID=2729614 RepID=A0A850Q308_9RHOB|nr:LysM peptidoglycan-binding domain-containing protein [Donghicola mangrovi]NVO24027.1 LysM peptidoglycan-binding domain-containing protein [Donghicola mangrovi]
MHPTIDIQQPQPYDIVGQTILVAGSAGAFEGTLSVYVTEGHDEFRTHVQVGSMGIRQFQGQVTVPDETAFTLPRLYLTLADDTGNEDGPSVTIPVLYGPLILPGYRGWQPYTVQSGDTLTRIARMMYGHGDYGPIFAANQDILASPDLIKVGQVLRIPRDDI